MTLKVTWLIFSFVFTLMGPFNASSQERHLISFEVHDQFDKVYTDKDYNGEILIIVASDKEGSKYNPLWSEAIQADLKEKGIFENVHMVGIAHLKGIPFFLKSFIKGKFPKDHEDSILMDWKGIFAKAYHFDAHVSNILVFDQNGKLVLKTHGEEIESHKLEFITDKLSSLVHQGSSGQ
jgi:predicted transcriptional regulator